MMLRPPHPNAVRLVDAVSPATAVLKIKPPPLARQLLAPRHRRPRHLATYHLVADLSSSALDPARE
jgi:hypothetical protein